MLTLKIGVNPCFQDELHNVEKQHVIPAMFDEVYKTITTGNFMLNIFLNANTNILKHFFIFLYHLFNMIPWCLGNNRWNNLEAPVGDLYPWDKASTYIKNPPFFDGMKNELPKIEPINDAFVLLNLGDSVTTDHISPAGSINRNSPAAR